jgi:hypothetical protein
MINNNSISKINISTSAIVYIEIKGQLNEELSDILGGLRIKNITNTDTLISSLEGVVADQAELMGILNTLYNMRYPIIEVKIK